MRREASLVELRETRFRTAAQVSTPDVSPREVIAPALPADSLRLRPRLLVSVRDGAEAEVAARYGAELLDLKEPRRGSLGSVAPMVAAELCRRWSGTLPVSVALGEVSEEATARALLDEIERLEPNVRPRWVKLGLAGSVRRGLEPREAWRRIAGQRPEGVELVAVAYADAPSADVPAAERVLDEAAASGLRTLLLDTYDKSRGSLWQLKGERWLVDWIARARAANLVVVVAGSLRGEELARVAALGPDVVAVRGAACESDRQGVVCGERVAWLRKTLAEACGEQVSNLRDSND